MDQQPNTTLPEINVLKQDDWDFLSKPPVQPQDESSQEPKDTQPTTTSDSESRTTGLTRALSLPRQLNKSTEQDSIRTEVININTANPSHLFWVPASQHPEIAPAEFEKYVDTHGLIVRKKSVKRRQSVLSVYFTANDHQKLMEECENAEAEKDRQAALNALESKTHAQTDSTEEEQEDNKKRKMILRRSVSLHLPTTGDYPRNVPDLLVFDRNSSPLDESRALVPKGDRPLLRRGARTNFKRNSSVTAPQRNRRSESDTIYSADPIQESSIVRSTSAEGVTLSDAMSDKDEPVALVDEPLPMLSTVKENEEVRDLCIATREIDREPLASSSPPAPVLMARSVSTSTTSTNQSRKSAWSWAFWSDEKSSKKNNKIDPTTPAAATAATNNQTVAAATLPVEEEKSNDNIAPTTTTSTSKRFTLSSLFSRKSKSNSNQNNGSYTTNFDLLTDDPRKAPKDFQLNRMHMTRLPLHVERAIYKLSHVKLANPRRPLHEQVLISNQMFWYLSVIATNAPQPTAYDMSIEEQPQKKPPRKRLVKKQRPVSAPQQPQHNRQQQHHPKKRANNMSTHNSNSNQKGNTNMFMANPRATESTGFVVPENYLNPKYQKQQEQLQQQQQQQQLQHQHQQHQQIKKKPMMGNKKPHMYYKQQQQGSDSSSSDGDDDDDDQDENSDDDQEEIAEKIIISHKEKEDELPLAMYKSNALINKIK